MIEISTYGDNTKIYIDFAYKGLPLDLPIENIRPFDPPKSNCSSQRSFLRYVICVNSLPAVFLI